MKKFSEAIDQIRREEVTKLKDEGADNVLEKSRWLLLKRPEGRLSFDMVEGFNLKAKRTMRKAYGCRSLECLKSLVSYPC